MKKHALEWIEQEFLRNLTDQIEDRVLSTRLEYLFAWYTRKAQFNKRAYNWTRFLTYLFPCLITLISVFASVADNSKNSKWAIIGVATISAILVGIQHVVDHFRFYENWVRYRGTVEKLKRESEIFLNFCEPYSSKSMEKNYRRFAANIEVIASSEISSWESLQEESYRPFREENQAAIQNGVSAVGMNQQARVRRLRSTDAEDLTEPDGFDPYEEMPDAAEGGGSEIDPETPA